ncbi:MAG: hypothetical protein IPJ71_11065 [Bdellovibrionales bacterium]|nr:hypothetical protein [Bdellovibrionales bacterium]
MGGRGNFKFYLWTSVLVSAIFLLSVTTLGDVSPLCDDLARFACAPGSYKDGTGEIKSEVEVSKLMSSYREKSLAFLHGRFEKLISDPNNSYFKTVAVAGLGLKNSPQCSSALKEDIVACKINLIEGLTTIAQKYSLRPLLPNTGLERAGNLREIDYIIGNNSFQRIVEELNDQAQKDLGNPETTKKIKEKVFPKIKDLIIARLNQMSIPDEQKSLMTSKVSSISFEGTTCEGFGGVGSSKGEIVSSLLVPNAYYNPIQNSFKVCSGYLLQSTSEFEIAATIAHELSHSIDPCVIALGPADFGFKYSTSQDLKKMENEYPIKNVIECLRDKRSIGALNFSSAKDEGASNKGGAMGQPASSKANSLGDSQNMIGPFAGEGPPTPQKPKEVSFCENDQIGESFCDWMAAEVLPTYMEENHKLTPAQYLIGYSNAKRLICRIEPEEDEKNLKYLDVHPPGGDRINKILLVNPKVRAQMGCPPKHLTTVYCDSEKRLDGPNEPKSPSAQPSQTVPATGAK